MSAWRATLTPQGLPEALSLAAGQTSGEGRGQPCPSSDRDAEFGGRDKDLGVIYN